MTSKELEDKAIEDCLHRMLQGNETEIDIEFLKSFDESRIKNILSSISNQNQAAIGKWQPSHGSGRDGKFYGKD